MSLGMNMLPIWKASDWRGSHWLLANLQRHPRGMSLEDGAGVQVGGHRILQQLWKLEIGCRESEVRWQWRLLGIQHDLCIYA